LKETDLFAVTPTYFLKLAYHKLSEFCSSLVAKAYLLDGGQAKDAVC
jgi:hypothetical protein